MLDPLNCTHESMWILSPQSNLTNVQETTGFALAVGWTNARNWRDPMFIVYSPLPYSSTMMLEALPPPWSRRKFHRRVVRYLVCSWSGSGAMGLNAHTPCLLLLLLLSFFFFFARVWCSFAMHLQDRQEHECLSRFISKFMEAGMEKVDRTMDLYMDYTEKWVIEEICIWRTIGWWIMTHQQDYLSLTIKGFSRSVIELMRGGALVISYILLWSRGNCPLTITNKGCFSKGVLLFSGKILGKNGAWRRVLYSPLVVML